MQKQLLKNYCWLWTKKVTNFMAHKKRLPNFGPKFWALILGQPPQSKLKFRLISIQFDYTPFHGCFLCGCIFILCQVAIFWLKKVQFSSQKCNFYLWKILHCNFWKNRKEEKKNYSKQQKCYTTSLRILSPKTERIFCRLVLISVSTKLGY